MGTRGLGEVVAMQKRVPAALSACLLLWFVGVRERRGWVGRSAGKRTKERTNARDDTHTQRRRYAIRYTHVADVDDAGAGPRGNRQGQVGLLLLLDEDGRVALGRQHCSSFCATVGSSWCVLVMGVESVRVCTYTYTHHDEHPGNTIRTNQTDSHPASQTRSSFPPSSPASSSFRKYASMNLDSPFSRGGRPNLARAGSTIPHTCADGVTGIG